MRRPDGAWQTHRRTRTVSIQSNSPGSPESSQMPLLLALPVPLAAIMMQQIARSDRLFPAERRELERLLQSLRAPRSSEMERAVQDFASLQLSKELRHADWQRDPAGFVDKMTAELWASNQINAFREAAKRLFLPPGRSMRKIRDMHLGASLSSSTRISAAPRARRSCSTSCALMAHSFLWLRMRVARKPLANGSRHARSQIRRHMLTGIFRVPPSIRRIHPPSCQFRTMHFVRRVRMS